jgi:hypothetical protein
MRSRVDAITDMEAQMIEMQRTMLAMQDSMNVLHASIIGIHRKLEEMQECADW